MARKIYTQAFKKQAVKQRYSNGKSVAMTAADLRLPPNMLHRWWREAKLIGCTFPGHDKARDENRSVDARHIEYALGLVE